MHPSLNEETTELLLKLAEEASEVAQACCNALHHGFDSFHPNDPSKDNLDLLQGEVTDLLAVVNMLANLSILEEIGEEEIMETVVSKIKWMNHQHRLEDAMRAAGY